MSFVTRRLISRAKSFLISISLISITSKQAVVVGFGRKGQLPNMVANNDQSYIIHNIYHLVYLPSWKRILITCCVYYFYEEQDQVLTFSFKIFFFLLERSFKGLVGRKNTETPPWKWYTCTNPLLTLYVVLKLNICLILSKLSRSVASCIFIY